MNENDKKIFEYVKEKAEKDKVLWHEAQKDHNSGLILEREEAMIERMFLVHFVERYLEQEKELEKFQEYIEINEIAENRMVEIDEEKNEKISLLEKEISELYKEIKELKGQIELYKDGLYERTRKDKVHDQYHAVRNKYPNVNKFDEGVLAGMSDTLYLLGIKIEGVNG